MYARVTTFTAKPGKLSEIIKGVRDTMPSVTKQKGSKGGFLLTNKETGKGFVIGLWNTEADLKAGENTPSLKEAHAKFGPLTVGPFTQEDYEVSSRA